MRPVGVSNCGLVHTSLVFLFILAWPVMNGSATKGLTCLFLNDIWNSCLPDIPDIIKQKLKLDGWHFILTVGFCLPSETIIFLLEPDRIPPKSWGTVLFGLFLHQLVGGFKGPKSWMFMRSKKNKQKENKTMQHLKMTTAIIMFWHLKLYKTKST